MVFTERHQLMRKLARGFAERELAPIAGLIDETGEFPQEVFDKMAKAGLFGLKAPQEFGGAGADTVSYVIVMEEITRVSATASLYISSPNSLSSAPLMLAGTLEQKKKFIPAAASGKIVICFALTEPDAGSDVGAIASTAVPDGDFFILNGRKTFITMAPFSDYAILFAKTDPKAGTRGITAFMLDMKLPGVSCGKPEKKMGLNGCATSDIVLENVRVPKDSILGRLNGGFSIAMKTLDIGRIGVASQGIGISQGALDEAVKYAKDRRQFGSPLAKHQSIAFELADMQTKLTAAKLMVYEAAQMMDRNENATAQAAMAKYFATEAAQQIVDRALQIFGGYGYMKDYPIERMYRDSRVFTIYEGTSQIQKIVISNMLLK
ncbi:MAG: acyl-CoA dehydrogenase family protein [Clostridiales bacterium]|jgi:alkylation response protein AidB-like acyl-CoA dehydrogenase|nr:acyl-CoA dehydrogenase family protein [Clostridiales bacterium]